MGSFCAFPSCSKQLTFSLFGSFWSDSRPFLTLFHTKRTHALASRLAQASFGFRFPRLKTFFEI